ncbi:cytochrome P450 family protein [Nocardia callitridis]|uniref:Cytochrome P450 n=1 Tax=Nocardia callitridis TaxID=648753 RepID=A0ABP9K7Y2_9NOCA
MDSGLRRRLQLVRGLQWLRSAEGDPLAAVLRGHPAAAPSTITDSVYRSTTGTVVVGGRHTAELFAASAGLADWRPTGTRVMAVAAEEIEPADPADVAALADTAPPAVGDVPDELSDLVPIAESLCAKAYADLLGVEPDSLLGATAVLDNFLCPQETSVTEGMLAAVENLRDALCPRTPAFFLAVVAPRLTADLVSRTAATLLADGRWPDVVGAVERVSAANPLLSLSLTTTTEDVTVAGEVIPGSSQVAVLNSPAVWPRTLDLPLVDATADAVVTAIATRHPRLMATGAPVRRRCAPATSGLAHLPVASLRTDPLLVR